MGKCTEKCRRNDKGLGRMKGYTEGQKHVLFTSNSDIWETPQHVFDELDREFKFTLDPCADENNHKCSRYYTKEQDGLKQDWGGK